MTNWEQVCAVQKMQNYIHAHIHEPITLHALAQGTGYSPWHCTKIFKALTNKTPFEYIRLSRLSQAALALRDKDAKVIDVALDFMFDSHEGFTRAFHKQFGLSPKDYKKSAPPVPLFHPWPIRDKYAYYLDGKSPKTLPSKAFSVQIRGFPDRKLLLKRGKSANDYFTYCEEVGCEIWGLLCSVKEALYEPIGLWLPDHLRPDNTSKYVQGVEVPVHYQGIIPEGFEIIDLPECKMMLFQTQPYDDIYFEQVIAALTEQINGYDPKADGYEWDDETAPRFQLDPQGWRGYIEAKPVKEII